jgi:hypothetical protein
LTVNETEKWLKLSIPYPLQAGAEDNLVPRLQLGNAIAHETPVSSKRSFGEFSVLFPHPLTPSPNEERERHF